MCACRGCCALEKEIIDSYELEVLECSLHLLTVQNAVFDLLFH